MARTPSDMNNPEALASLLQPLQLDSSVWPWHVYLSTNENCKHQHDPNTDPQVRQLSYALTSYFLLNMSSTSVR
jgi:hypothetical protein